MKTLIYSVLSFLAILLGAVGIALFIYVLCQFVVWFITPSEPTKIEIHIESKDEEARQICIKEGGIPISSVWTGMIKDCKKV